MESEISISAELISLATSPEKLKTVARQKRLADLCEWFQKNPRKYDSSVIAKMKNLGLKRPEWIPREDWQPQKKQFESKGELIARLAACGMNPKEISKRMDLKEESVASWIKDPKIKERIYALQDQMFGGDPRKLFKSALHEAFNTELEILRKENAKDSVRLNAAQDLMDRAAGKAPQEINVNDSNIRSLIERMDKIERAGGFDALEVKALDVQDAEFSEVGDNQKEPRKEISVEENKDPVDRWLVESGFCQNDSTGKNQ